MNLLQSLIGAQQSPAALPSLTQVVLHTPEEGTGECYAVGVSLIDPEGKRQARWLRDFSRLHCAYGETASRHLPLLLRMAEEQWTAGSAITVPQLHTTPPRSSFGNPATLLDELFTLLVPLARPRPAAEQARSRVVANRTLHRRVFSHMRRRHGTDAERVIAQNPNLTWKDGATNRVLHVPLQAQQRFGVLVSARCSTPAAVDRNVLPAVTMLQTAGSLKKVENLAVFVLRATEDSLRQDQFQAVDEHTEDLVWMLGRQNVTMFPELSAEHLADAVTEWGLS